MIYLKKFVVLHNYLDDQGGYDLFWEFEGIGFPAKYQIEWSPVEANSPWTLVGTYATDYAIGVLDKALTLARKAFFRIKVLDGNQVMYTSVPCSGSLEMPRYHYLRWREMLRHERLDLTKYKGTRAFLFSRKLSGEPCPICMSPILERSADPQCPVCFGQSFTGGYNSPIEMYADPGENTIYIKNQTEEEHGVSDVTQIQVKTFAYPAIKYKDIWVPAHGTRRWGVIKVVEDHYFEHPICQTLFLTILPPTDITYKLPVSV